jgi:hypothetical protein
MISQSPTKKRVLNFLSVIVAIFLVVIHGVSVWFRVISIPPEKYLQYEAVDLKVTPNYRYGYVADYHGSFLVKTSNGPEFASYQLDNDNDKDVFAWMKKDLEWYPRKAALEAVFYGAVWAYAFALAPWLRKRMQGVHWLGRTILRGAFWAGGWALITSPLMLLDYGCSLYTTYNTPGAAGYSGPYFGIATGFAAETISYRHVVELTGGPATISMVDLLPAGLVHSVRDCVFWSGILAYGMVGLLLEAAGSGIHAVIRRFEPTPNRKADT